MEERWHFELEQAQRRRMVMARKTGGLRTERSRESPGKRIVDQIVIKYTYQGFAGLRRVPKLNNAAQPLVYATRRPDVPWRLIRFSREPFR
jgi:hypothetical protein